MDWILKKWKEAKEYESQLAECSKPFVSFTEKIDSYLRELNRDASNMSKSIYEYFYWSVYFGYMCSEVIIPLFRVYVLIDRKHGYPLLFSKDDDTTGVIPCTYSEAYAFFHELNIEDTKAILQHWVSPLDYVNLLDCIEQDDYARFATVFSNIENAENKLRTINCAQRMLPLYKMSNELIKFLARKDFQKVEKQIESMRLDEIVSSYNWSSFDDFRCFIEDLFTDIVSNTSEIVNDLNALFNFREVYETLISPSFRALDFRDPNEYNNAVSICEQWDSSPMFVRLWRDLANMFFYLIYRAFKELSEIMSEREKAVVSYIINNNSRISQLRLNAVIQFYYLKIENTVAETVKSAPAIYIESKADKIRSIGQPYFEAAKDRNPIELQIPGQSTAEGISFSLPENFFNQKNLRGSFHMDLCQEIISAGVKKFETFLNALSDYGYINREDLPLLAYRLTGCGEPFGEDQITWHKEQRVIRYVISKFHAPGTYYASKLDKYFIGPQGNTFLHSIKAESARNIKKLPIIKEVIKPLYGEIIK